MKLSDRQDNYFKFTGLFLLFLLLAFDRDLAMIYIFIMFIDYVWYSSDNFVSFPLSKGLMTRTQVILESLAAFGIFLTISTVLVSTFSPQSLTGTGIVGQTQSIFQLLATTTPILQGSKILTLIGWGVVVPIIETSFFNGRLLEGFATYAEEVTGRRIPVDKLSGALFLVIIVIAALFTTFHITAKGIESIPLLITFIFSVISSLLVIRHRELRGAVFLHIGTNSSAVAASIGWL